MDNNQNLNISEEEGLNIKEIVERYLYHWKWIILAVIVALSCAYVYLRYSNPVYSSKATVLIKDEKGGNGFSEMDMMKDLGFGGGSSSLENEIEIYKSRSILEKVVRKLQINKSVVAIGDRSGLERAELYDRSPIFFDYQINDSVESLDNFEFELELGADEMLRLSLVNSNDELNKKGKFGAWIQFENLRLRILPTEYFSSEMIGRSFILRIVPIERMVTGVKNQLQVTAVSKDADILILSIKGRGYSEKQ